MLSGYRLMWMLVMFDLPVVEKKERKAATAFRKVLLDQGFEMAQFSVYLRNCTGPEHADTLTRKVQGELPEGGKVDILYFTDKQYEKIASFVGKKRSRARKNPDQFNLF